MYQKETSYTMNRLTRKYNKVRTTLKCICFCFWRVQCFRIPLPWKYTTTNSVIFFPIIYHNELRYYRGCLYDVTNVANVVSWQRGRYFRYGLFNPCKTIAVKSGYVSVYFLTPSLSPGRPVLIIMSLIFAEPSQ